MGERADGPLAGPPLAAVCRGEPGDLTEPLAPEVIAIRCRREPRRGAHETVGEHRYPRPRAGVGVRIGESARNRVSAVSSALAPCAVTR